MAKIMLCQETILEKMNRDGAREASKFVPCYMKDSGIHVEFRLMLETLKIILNQTRKSPLDPSETVDRLKSLTKHQRFRAVVKICKSLNRTSSSSYLGKHHVKRHSSGCKLPS